MKMILDVKSLRRFFTCLFGISFDKKYKKHRKEDVEILEKFIFNELKFPPT